MLENVMLPLYLKKQPDKLIAQKVLRELRIEELENQKVSKLSGSQMQRVAIARELVKSPNVILADEPTGNLDSQNSSDVIELLTRASKIFRQTILMITHNVSLTSSADRVFHVADGVLTDLGGANNEKLS